MLQKLTIGILSLLLALSASSINTSVSLGNLKGNAGSSLIVTLPDGTATESLVSNGFMDFSGPKPVLQVTAGPDIASVTNAQIWLGLQQYNQKLVLLAITPPPAGPADTGKGWVYLSISDKKLHLRDDAGVDTAQ